MRGKEERVGHDYPNLKETLKPLVEGFLKNEDSALAWGVFPDNIDINHAEMLIEEAENYGLVLPQSAEDFLTYIHGDEFRTRHRAALILRLIGLRIKEVEELENERTGGRLSRNFTLMAHELELGRLDPEKLLRT